MKAALFHGTGGSPNHFWFPWLISQLEAADVEAWAPQLPDTDNPSLDTWLPVAAEHPYDAETTLIGHSAGCALILALLEQLATPVKQTVLVAGYAQPLTNEPSPILRDVWDWESIRRNGGEMYFVNSDNDPWGCNDNAGRYLFNHLGGTQIILEGQGHMGSERFDQPYRQFPLVAKLVL